MTYTMQKRRGRPPLDERLSYYEHKLRISRHFIRMLMMLAAIINLLLLVPDLTIIEGSDARISIAVIRAVYSGILIIIGLRIGAIPSFKELSIVITICELAAVGIFLYVFSCYSNPDFPIQTMGIITLVIIIFSIPNRWGCMLFAALVEEACFFACTLLFVKSINEVEFTAAVSYVSVAIVLCAVAAKDSEIHQIREYAAKSELERISSTDYLTDTANRFKLNEEAERWIAFCKRQQLPLSLVFFDVDDLKHINDEFGHSAGDSVLASVAKLTKDRLRSSDILARWGGDEFVILLPNVSIGDAAALCERIMEGFESSEFVNGTCVTCSFGVAEMKNDSTFEAMVNEADGLMYKAKRRGKALIQYRKA